MAFVPQGRILFGQLSVIENLELFPRVKERLHSAASSLSGGEQKQLEVGRALLLRPKVLLIDEPSIGLSPLVVQNVKSALKMADEAIALESGRRVLHEGADELLADPDVERLFLGGAHVTPPQAA